MVETPADSLQAAGRRLRDARKAAGYVRQADLAKELDVSQSAVSKWERGHLPTVSDLRRVARLLGVTLDHLLEPVILETSSPEEVRRRETMRELLEVLDRRQAQEPDDQSEGPHA